MPRHPKLLFCLYFDEIKEHKFSSLLHYIYNLSTPSTISEHQKDLRDSFRLLLNKHHYLAILSKNETRSTVNNTLKLLGLLDHEVNRIFILEEIDSITNAIEQFNITDAQYIYLIKTAATAPENSASENYQVLHINPKTSSPNCLEKINDIIDSLKDDLLNVRIEAGPEIPLILREAKPEEGSVADKDDIYVVSHSSDSPPDMRPKHIKHLNKYLARLLPLGKLAQLSIAFTLGLSLATGTLGSLLVGFCLISGIVMVDVLRYSVQSKRTLFQIRRLESDIAIYKETDPEIYDLGYQSKKWAPYLKSYITPKAYKNHDVYEAGLADALLSELESSHHRKAL